MMDKILTLALVILMLTGLETEMIVNQLRVIVFNGKWFDILAYK